MENEISEILINQKINRKKMIKWLDEFISNIVTFFKTENNKDLVLQITWNTPFIDLIIEAIEN